MNSIQKNINFLEYPLFFPTKSDRLFEEWKTEGYTIVSRYGLPTNTDINFLNGILLKAQTTKSNIVSYENFRDVVVSAGYHRGSFDYDRIFDVLYRWKHTKLEYKKFYLEKDYVKKSFKGIITQLFHNDRTNSLTITLNNNFYQANLDRFSKSIRLDFFNRLTPTAKRIYEILTKNFYKRSKWVVGCDTFLTKIPILNKADKSVNKYNLHRYVKEINKNLILYGTKNIFNMNLLKDKDLIVFNLVQLSKSGENGSFVS